MAARNFVNHLAGLTGLTVSLGLLIAVIFALAKYTVINGIPVFAAFYWQVLGASLILMTIITWQGQRLSMHRHHLRYYMIGGLLGVSAPQLMAYAALQHIPSGLFAVLLTLSPIATFLLASIYERALLPFYRLVGIVIGLTGVSIATFSGFNINTNGAAFHWLLLAFTVPLVLGVTNVYRSKALPTDAEPLSLAAGTLLSQAFIMTPIIYFNNDGYQPLVALNPVDFVLLALAAATALSYLLTFAMQRLTDGVGFSQIGYFVTLGGVIIGALFFDETIGLSLLLSIALIFTGLAISNGHFRAGQKETP